MSIFSFDYASGVLILTFSLVVIVPCVLIGRIGKRMIEDLGRFPSRSAVIQMSVFWKLVFIELITFSLMIAVFIVFSGK